MKDFLISPPFGNFISHSKCTSVIGTYTLHQRGGWLKKLYRALLTIRPAKGGWVNNIGLQNPGIKSVKKFNPSKIYSITAIETKEWDELFKYIPENTLIELNLSCPNIKQKTIIEDEQIRNCLNKFPNAIFKLSPTEEIYNQIDKLISRGAQYIHIANTLPTSRGGESGIRLKEFSLNAIRKTREKYPNIKIIGGGGIYSQKDLDLYKKAGANYFSLASIWFNPIRACILLRNMV